MNEYWSAINPVEFSNLRGSPAVTTSSSNSVFALLYRSQMFPSTENPRIHHGTRNLVFRNPTFINLRKPRKIPKGIKSNFGCSSRWLYWEVSVLPLPELRTVLAVLMKFLMSQTHKKIKGENTYLDIFVPECRVWTF